MQINNHSIHLIEGGRRPLPISNTSRPTSRARLVRVLASLEKHLDQHPRDGVTATRIGNVKVRIAELGKSS